MSNKTATEQKRLEEVLDSLKNQPGIDGVYALVNTHDPQISGVVLEAGEGQAPYLDSQELSPMHHHIVLAVKKLPTDLPPGVNLIKR